MEVLVIVFIVVGLYAIYQVLDREHETIARMFGHTPYGDLPRGAQGMGQPAALPEEDDARWEELEPEEDPRPARFRSWDD